MPDQRIEMSSPEPVASDTGTTISGTTRSSNRYGALKSRHVTIICWFVTTLSKDAFVNKYYSDRSCDRNWFDYWSGKRAIEVIIHTP